MPDPAFALPDHRPIARLGAWLALIAVLVSSISPAQAAFDVRNSTTAHLVISEVVTGGTSPSDEFIEIFNPTGSALPLEGLELIYVSASGASVTRKAAWPLGAAEIPPGGHLLAANDAGLFRAIADVRYSDGLAALGGSVALRIQGASAALDAVGWGTAASSWLEGTPAAAPSAGTSLERLPGGEAGSGQDTDANAADFVLRQPPDPQSSASPPLPGPSQTVTPSPTESTPASASAPPTASASPSITPLPSATASPSGSATPSASAAATPTPTASPPVTPIALARALPDGARVTIAGVALTASDFVDGGGYVADAGGGIAVLVTDGAYARGELVTVSGTLEDRYQQRTLRAAAADLRSLAGASAPAAQEVATGAVGEAWEGRLVSVVGTVRGSATTLSSGTAFDLDDGSGTARVLVPTSSGIDLAAWGAGATVRLVGVVGQRDSTGSGAAGYRVQPRDPADVRSVAAASPSATPTAAPASSASGGASATPSSVSPLVSIAALRAAAVGERAGLRGVVTCRRASSTSRPRCCRTTAAPSFCVWPAAPARWASANSSRSKASARRNRGWPACR